MPLLVWLLPLLLLLYGIVQARGGNGGSAINYIVPSAIWLLWAAYPVHKRLGMLRKLGRFAINSRCMDEGGFRDDYKVFSVSEYDGLSKGA